MLQNVLHGDPKRNLVVLSPENPIKKTRKLCRIFENLSVIQPTKINLKKMSCSENILTAVIKKSTI